MVSVDWLVWSVVSLLVLVSLSCVRGLLLNCSATLLRRPLLLYLLYHMGATSLWLRVNYQFIKTHKVISSYLLIQMIKIEIISTNLLMHMKLKKNLA